MKRLQVPLALLLVSAALLGAAPQFPDAQLLNRVSKLDPFRCVTKERVPLWAKYAALCAPLRNPADHTTLTGKPDAAILVYVSPEAFESFREEHYPLPEGTIILKEKFASHEAASPELYTGMLKRENGYNPKAGDWEFFTLTGDRQAITSRGRIDSCMDCHQSRAKSDFLMRHSYRGFLDLSAKK
jgi:hypothetical protein